MQALSAYRDDLPEWKEFRRTAVRSFIIGAAVGMIFPAGGSISHYSPIYVAVSSLVATLISALVTPFFKWMAQNRESRALNLGEVFARRVFVVTTFTWLREAVQVQSFSRAFSAISHGTGGVRASLVFNMVIWAVSRVLAGASPPDIPETVVVV